MQSALLEAARDGCHFYDTPWPNSCWSVLRCVALRCTVFCLGRLLRCDKLWRIFINLLGRANGVLSSRELRVTPCGSWGRVVLFGLLGSVRRVQINSEEAGIREWDALEQNSYRWCSRQLCHFEVSLLQWLSAVITLTTLEKHCCLT